MSEDTTVAPELFGISLPHLKFPNKKDILVYTTVSKLVTVSALNDTALYYNLSGANLTPRVPINFLFFFLVLPHATHNTPPCKRMLQANQDKTFTLHSLTLITIHRRHMDVSS